MSVRTLTRPAMCARTLGVGMLVAAGALSFGGASRVGLGADLMALSRGNNPWLEPAALNCTTYNYPAPCTQPNAVCNICTGGSYAGLVYGESEGYDVNSGNQTGCGSIEVGLCDANLACVIRPPAYNACEEPDFYFEEED
jgi:hypothetical protein